MTQNAEELGEVVVFPMTSEFQIEIETYKRRRQIDEFWNAGENLQFSAARYFENKNDYKDTPFIKEISFVTNNSLNKKVPLSVKIVEADSKGRPTERSLSKNYLIEVGDGREEVHVDLSKEKFLMPEHGFFVVLDRIYQKEYRHLNKHYEEGKSIKYVYQPALGMTKNGSAENLWWFYGGSWKSPSELKDLLSFETRDLAVNVVLSD